MICAIGCGRTTRSEFIHVCNDCLTLSNAVDGLPASHDLLDNIENALRRLRDHSNRKALEAAWRLGAAPASLHTLWTKR